MLASSIKNMLKKMGSEDSKVFKAQNIVTYRHLINQHVFDVILCSFTSQKRVVGARYYYLYQNSLAYSKKCSFIMVANGRDEQQLQEVEELGIDNVLGYPFNYIQLKQTLTVSLLKRDILRAVHKHLMLGYFESVMRICDAQLKRKGSKWFGCHKVVVDYYVEQANYSAAFKTLERVHQQVKHPWPLMMLISLHHKLGNDDIALALAHEYELLGYPAEPLISQITASQSLLDNNVEQAIEVMSRLCQRFPHRVDLTINCSMLHIGVGAYRKAKCCLAQVDYDSIVNDEQLIQIEEMQLFLDLIIAFQGKRTVNPGSIKATMNQMLVIKESTLKDSHPLTKGIYHLLLQMNRYNPVYSPKRLSTMYSQTAWLHRKLILMAVALNIGCLELVRKWSLEMKQQNHAKKDFTVGVNELILKRIDVRLAKKVSAIRSAKKKESEGSVIDSLAIKAKEVPYFISHHSHFINAMLKCNIALHHDVKLLAEQFSVSVNIVTVNLMKHDASHPKVNKIMQAKQIVEQRLQTVA